MKGSPAQAALKDIISGMKKLHLDKVVGHKKKKKVLEVEEEEACEEEED